MQYTHHMYQYLRFQLNEKAHVKFSDSSNCCNCYYSLDKNSRIYKTYQT